MRTTADRLRDALNAVVDMLDGAAPNTRADAPEWLALGVWVAATEIEGADLDDNEAHDLAEAWRLLCERDQPPRRDGRTWYVTRAAVESARQLIADERASGPHAPRGRDGEPPPADQVLSWLLRCIEAGVQLVDGADPARQVWRCEAAGLCLRVDAGRWRVMSASPMRVAQ